MVSSSNGWVGVGDGTDRAEKRSSAEIKLKKKELAAVNILGFTVIITELFAEIHLFLTFSPQEGLEEYSQVPCANLSI